MKAHLFLLAVFIGFSSCAISIHGLSNDYDELSVAQKGKVTVATRFAALSADSVYKVTGSQLREELQKYPQSIVYIFKSGCTSQYCKPLFVFENYARDNHYKLFLVMDGYEHMDLTTDQHPVNPLFVINDAAYNTRKRAKYIERFQNDLTNKPLKTKRKFEGGLFFFNGNQLQKSVKELPKAN